MTNIPRHSLRLFTAIAALTICIRANAEQSYYPLKGGHVGDFVYTLTVNDMGVDSKSGIISLRNLPLRNLGGKAVTPIVITVKGQPTPDGSISLTAYSFQAEDVTGVYEYATQGTDDADPVISATPKCILRYPIKLGARWEVKDATSIVMITPVTILNTIESEKEAIKTPAGSFKHCVMVKGVGRTGTITNALGTLAQIDVERTSWYAPGVGLVQAVMTETNNGYNVKLKQKYVVSGKWEQRLQEVISKP